MLRPVRVAVVCVLAAAVALAARGDGDKDDPGPAWQTIIPEAELAKVVGEAAKAVEKDLAAADKDPRARSRARASALLIAAYAQGSIKGEGAAARDRAALRDAALKLAGAIAEKKVAEATKLAQGLPAAKATDATRTAAVPLSKADDRDEVLPDVMALFKPRARGGLGVWPQPADANLDGIDARLDQLATRTLKKDDLAKQADGLVLTAYQTATIADLAHSLSPEKKEGDKDPKDWRRWSRALREASADLAGAARAGDPDKVRKAAGQAAGACIDCHKVFRMGS